jgi:hypothetical protein
VSKTKWHPAAWRDPDTAHQKYIYAARAQGYGQPILWTGIEDYQRAVDIRRGIHRARKQLNESASANIIRAVDGTWTVEITVWDKAVARQYIKDQGRFNAPRSATERAQRS